MICKAQGRGTRFAQMPHAPTHRGISAAFPSPRITVFGKELPSFQVAGYTGLILGFAQSSILVRRLGLSQLTLLGITGVVILTFWALTMATKIVTGKEQIINYHHEIAVATTTALFLRTTHQPVLCYLDIAGLGIGLFLACGRMGCLMVGCCHGRPWRWGVRYGGGHSQAGFPAYLVGVSLFPIQAVESLFVLCLVASGMGAVLKGSPPGTAFALFVTLYALGRFCFEFGRGDAARPYLGGFSEAQWTSLAVAIAVSCAEHANLMPCCRWHTFIPLLLFALAVMVSVNRRRVTACRFELLHPRHIREVAEAVQIVGDAAVSLGREHRPFLPVPGAQVIHVAQTSRGIRISSGAILQGKHLLCHYTLSNQISILSADSARLLGILIARLRHNSSRFKLIAANSGVYHLVFDMGSS
jgi:hypothetical protein